VNGKKVLRLMREDNLLAQRRAPFLKASADKLSSLRNVPNLVHGLVPSAPDQLWVADIVFVHLARSFVYLAVILDVFSRKAVGWAFENTLDASRVIAVLDTALDARKPRRGLIHHSDRGVHYALIAYRQRLARHGIVISMSGPGNPADNAGAESLMTTLKAQEINGRAFADIRDARRCVDGFIDEVYNKDRLHAALGYPSRPAFEAALLQNGIA